MTTLALEIEALDLVDERGVVPILDGVSLLDIVREWERSEGLVSPLEYAPLVPHSVVPPFGPRHWYGDPVTGSASLLGCECGEAGCWPLVASIGVSAEHVIWSGFSQPNRGEWNYEIGPFVFDRAAYDLAVAALFEPGCA